MPLVATGVRGIPEIVTYREGALLIEPGDISNMSGFIARSLKETSFAQQLVTHSQERILKFHAPEAPVRRLLYILCRPV